MIAIREADQSEFDEVAELVVGAYRTLPDERDPGYEEFMRDVARRAIDSAVLVAVDDGRIVGSVTLAPPGGALSESDDPEAATIRMLGVAAHARGRGVGEGLVRECVARARALGASRVRLDTRPSMRAAHRLYERLGFRRDPDRDWWPTPRIDLLAYVLELPSPAADSDEVERPRTTA